MTPSASSVEGVVSMRGECGKMTSTLISTLRKGEDIARKTILSIAPNPVSILPQITSAESTIINRKCVKTTAKIQKCSIRLGVHIGIIS